MFKAPNKRKRSVSSGARIAIYGSEKGDHDSQSAPEGEEERGGDKMQKKKKKSKKNAKEKTATKKQNKKKRSSSKAKMNKTLLSFADEDDEGDDKVYGSREGFIEREQGSGQHHKHKEGTKELRCGERSVSISAGGMGYGGFNTFQENDDNRIDEEGDAQHSREDDNESDQNSGESETMYSTEALQKLRRGQRHYFDRPQPSSSTGVLGDCATRGDSCGGESAHLTNGDGDDTNMATRPTNHANKARTSDSVARTDVSDGFSKVVKSGFDDNFIPLDASSDGHNDRSLPVILAGDEALSLSENKETKKSHSDDGAAISTSGQFDDDDEGRRWEEHLVGRGLRTQGRTINGIAATVSAKVSANDSSLSATVKSGGMDFSSPPSSSMSSSSLTKIKSALLSTIEKLSETKSNLSTSLERRRVELDNLRSTLERHHQKDLQSLDEKFRFHQQLRLSIVNRIGALREIDNDLIQVETTLQQIYKERADMRIDRMARTEDDAVEALTVKNGLGTVLGRKVHTDSSATLASVTEVDEFGRDLGHMRLMELERRWKDRVERLVGRRRRRRDGAIFSVSDDGGNRFEDVARDMGELTDVEIDVEEEDNFHDRTRAILSAADLLLRSRFGSTDRKNENCKDEEPNYESLRGLIETFDDWEGQHPETFNQCYAKLSLRDLAAVLVRLEMIHCWVDLLRPESVKDEQDENDGKRVCLADLGWFQELTGKSFDCVVGFSRAEGVEESSRKNQGEIVTGTMISAKDEEDNVRGKNRAPLLEAIQQKVIIPRYLHIIKHSYNPHSSHQTCRMVNFHTWLKSHLPEKLRLQMDKAIVTCLVRRTDNIAIPLLKDGFDCMHCRGRTVRLKDFCSDDIVEVFALSQIYRLTKIVRLACTFWSRALDRRGADSGDDALAKFVLMNVIAKTILPALSSLNFRTTTEEDQNDGRLWAESIFFDLMESVQKTKWLEAEIYMMYSAPLRAAIKTYTTPPP